MNPIYSGFLLPSLLWVRENEPENYKRVRYVCLPKDYIKFKLTGKLLPIIRMPPQRSLSILEMEAGRRIFWTFFPFQ